MPVLILAAAALLIYVLFVTRPKLEPLDQPEPVFTISAVEAAHRDIQPRLKLFGEVVAGRRSELRALVAGQIVAVGAHLRDGGVVKRGEMLVQIDRFDYETALAEQQATLQEAQARLEKLRRDLGDISMTPHAGPDSSRRAVEARRDLRQRRQPLSPGCGCLLPRAEPALLHASPPAGSRHRLSSRP